MLKTREYSLNKEDKEIRRDRQWRKCRDYFTVNEFQKKGLVE